MADIQKRIEIVSTYKDETNNKLKKTINSITQMKNGLEKTTKTINTFGKNGKVQIDKITTSVKKMGTESGRSTFATMRTFRMLSLSMMVAGYALMRTFKEIANASISAFQEIINTNGFLKTNINSLAASWEFLKFTIGSAINTTLGPLMPILLDIINKFADWIEQHPKLVGWIIILGLILGTLIGVFGLLGYAISGLLGVSGLPGLAKAMSEMTFTGFLGGLASVFGWIIAVVGAVYALKGIWDQWNNSSKESTSNLNGFGKILAFIAQLFFFLMNLVYIGARVITLGIQDIIDTFWLLADTIKIAIIGALNLVSHVFESWINFFIDGINMAIAGLNKLGAHIKEIPRVNLGLVGEEDLRAALDDGDKHLANIVKNSDALSSATPSLSDLWKQSALDFTQGTTSNTQSGANPDLTSTGGYGANIQTVGQGSNVTINQNNNFSGVAKDLSDQIQSAVNDGFQKAYQTAKQYKT